MLVRFSSVKTGSIVMFGDIAAQLIRMLGATGNIPGAIAADDIPAALRRLRERLDMHGNDAEPAIRPESDIEPDESEPLVGLSTRALPLIDILERAAAANVPVMWEAV